MHKKSSKHHIGLILIGIVVLAIILLFYFVLTNLPSDIFKGEIIPEGVSKDVVQQCRLDCGDFISGSPQFRECFDGCVGE